jgi:hypothetical protein
MNVSAKIGDRKVADRNSGVGAKTIAGGFATCGH